MGTKQDVTMDQLQSGNLQIRASKNKLIFEISGQPGATTEVEAEDLPRILAFLKNHGDSHNNRRLGFRLDLSQLPPGVREQLRVHALTDVGRVPVTPVDISITGIRVDSDKLEGKPGQQTTLEVDFEDTRVILPAVLVRRFADNRRLAFHFPEIFGEDGRLRPPAELTEIIYALESLWLDQNLDLKWNLA